MQKIHGEKGQTIIELVNQEHHRNKVQEILSLMIITDDIDDKKLGAQEQFGELHL